MLCSHVLSTGSATWIMWSSKRPCKALQNLEVIFPSPNARRISAGMNLRLIQESTTSLQLYWNLASGLHYARLYGKTCVLWWMPEPSEGDWKRQKRWPKTGNLPSKRYWMINQSKTADRVTKCGEKVLIIPVCVFAILTALCKNLEIYTCMTSLRRVGTCVSI